LTGNLGIGTRQKACRWYRPDSFLRAWTGRVKGRRNAPNSDHYPFVERGVKGMFIYTLGGPPHYHDVHDTYAHMEFQRYVQVRELMRGFLDALMAH
jgi:aminopeptidase YwaD